MIEKERQLESTLRELAEARQEEQTLASSPSAPKPGYEPIWWMPAPSWIWSPFGLRSTEP